MTRTVLLSVCLSLTSCGGDPFEPDRVAGDAGSSCKANLQTDPQHCGACGHACIEASCEGGHCRPRELVGSVSPVGVAVQGANLYFVDEGAGTINIMPKDGALSPEVFADGQSGAAYVAIDQTHVYWTRRDDGAVVQLALSGGTPTAIATGYQTPLGIGLAGGAAYVAEPTSGKVWKLGLDGTPISAVGEVGASLLVEGVATDGASLWITLNGSDAVQRMALSGGPFTQFENGQDHPAGIAVDEQWVYWVNQNSGELRKAPKAAGAVITLALELQWPTGVAVDDRYVYVAEAHAGRIVRIAK